MKRRRIESGVSSMCAPLAAPQVENPSAAELNSLYEVLFEVGQPVSLSLAPDYSESFTPLCTKGVLPKPLTELYRMIYHLTVSYITLLGMQCSKLRPDTGQFPVKLPTCLDIMHFDQPKCPINTEE